MCVSTRQISITSCYGLHSAIQAIEFIDYLFYDLLQPLQWLKTRRPAVKTNPLASQTEMVCWGQHNVTTQKSFRKLHLAAQNQRCSSHNTSVITRFNERNWAGQHTASKRIYWHFPISYYCKYNPVFTVNQPARRCPGFNFGLVTQLSDAVCAPNSNIKFLL